MNILIIGEEENSVNTILEKVSTVEIGSKQIDIFRLVEYVLSSVKLNNFT